MDRADSSRVLVVDDEPQITRVLKTVLTSEGYDVRTAAEGESALANFREWSPDLVITDLYMPHMNGEERTKVDALDSGADDYVTKPFGMDELMARVRAALRRSNAPAGDDTGSFDAGDFRIDMDARRVHTQGREVRLTPKEFDLFVY